MPRHKREHRDQNVRFSRLLKWKLSREGIKVPLTAGVIDTDEGHLAVLVTLPSCSNSLTREHATKAQEIAKEVCLQYFQSEDE